MKNNLFSAEWLNRYYLQHEGTVPPLRNEPVDARRLEQLAIEHKGQPYTEAFYEELAVHPNADELLHRTLLRLSDPWQAVVSSIATSGLASTKLLNDILARGVDSQDELHIRLALFANELGRSSPEDFASLLSGVTGDDEASIAAREQMAYNVRTPTPILRRLADDQEDQVAKAAANALQKRIA